MCEECLGHGTWYIEVNVVSRNIVLLIKLFKAGIILNENMWMVGNIIYMSAYLFTMF